MFADQLEEASRRFTPQENKLCLEVDQGTAGNASRATMYTVAEREARDMRARGELDTEITSEFLHRIVNAVRKRRRRPR